MPRLKKGESGIRKPRPSRVHGAVVDEIEKETKRESEAVLARLDCEIRQLEIQSGTSTRASAARLSSARPTISRDLKSSLMALEYVKFMESIVVAAGATSNAGAWEPHFVEHLVTAVAVFLVHQGLTTHMSTTSHTEPPQAHHMQSCFPIPWLVVQGRSLCVERLVSSAPLLCVHRREA